jgi:phenylacetate-CoA ligase
MSSTRYGTGRIAARLKRLAELERTQWLPAAEKERRQWEALQQIVEYARQHSPYYRRVLAEHGINDVRSMDDFTRIPVTTKDDIRRNQDAMISDQFRKEDLASAKTGGSTGVSLQLYFDLRCEERRNAAAIRSDRWAGWDLGVWRGALWGNPPKDFSIKRSLRNTLMDRVFVLDTMEMVPATMDAFLEEARSKHKYALFGHAHSIYILARHAQQRTRKIGAPAAIISTSMMLLDHERALIEQVFRCPVTNRYGCEEVGLIACQCERHNELHINTDDLVVEVLREDGSPASAGEAGRIVLTDLANRGMPLLRYRVEDVGVLSSIQCDCGRSGPLLESITGRVADFLKKPDGTMVAGVSLIERTLTAVPGIEQMQLVQERISELQINLVRGAGFTADSESRLREAMRAVFGESMVIQLTNVDSIPQERNGKYRFAICRV